MLKTNSFLHIYLCDIYVVSWVLQQYTDMYVHASMALLGTLTLMMFISFYYFYQAVAIYRLKGFIKSLVLFLLFLSIYGILHWSGEESIGDSKPTGFLLGNWSSLSPVLVFYISTLKGNVNENRMYLYFSMFLLIAVLRYEHNYITHDLEVEEFYMNAGFTNNAAYFFACMLPFVFFFEKVPLLKYAVLFICLYFVMNGMKRGALLVSGLFLLFYIWASVYKSSSVGSKGKRVLSALLFILIILALSYYVNYSWLNNDYVYKRLQAISEGDTNGRTEIYRILINNFYNNSSLFHMLFGYGAEGTMKVAQIHAHNDWLELLTDCGIAGVIIYFVYFYSFYIDCRRYKNILPEEKILLSCLLILFLRSFFSMSFMNMYMGTSCILGYGLARCEQIQRQYLYG